MTIEKGDLFRFKSEVYHNDLFIILGKKEDLPYVDGTKRWFFKDEEVTWQQLFRNANGDLEKECRILTYALT